MYEEHGYPHFERQYNRMWTNATWCKDITPNANRIRLIREGTIECILHDEEKWELSDMVSWSSMQ